jgi:hypothetical protein
MPPRRPAAVPQPWDQAGDPALAYATQQLSWYRRSMNRSRRSHYVSEILVLLCTAATVVVSALGAPAAATASIAAVVLFLTGYRQVFNPNDRWVACNAAWVELHQELARYRLVPEAERDAARRRALLDRTIEISTTENRAWAERRRAVRLTASAGGGAGDTDAVGG